MSERQVEVPDQVIAAGAEAMVPGVPGTDRAQPENLVEAVTEPGKVMRIGSMVKQLLDEVRGSQLDVGSRERLAEIYERSIVELAGALSPDLQEELRMLALPFSEGVPSEGELRVAQAQLVGWLEGLFHGIQATLFAQQMAARQQFDQMRQIGHAPDENAGGAGRPGTYL
ncbi:MAG: proteasome activator [Actinomycetota bacterium]